MKESILKKLIDNGDLLKLQAYLLANPSLNLLPMLDEEQTSPLMYAIFYRKEINIVKELMNSQINFLFPNSEGMTSLSLAAQENLFLISRLLLKKQSALLNQIDNEGNTPLHYCVRYTDNPVMAHFLLLKGGNCSIINSDGETILQIAQNNGFLPRKQKKDLLKTITVAKTGKGNRKI